MPMTVSPGRGSGAAECRQICVDAAYYCYTVAVILHFVLLAALARPIRDFAVSDGSRRTRRARTR